MCFIALISSFHYSAQKNDKIQLFKKSIIYEIFLDFMSRGGGIKYFVNYRFSILTLF